MRSQSGEPVKIVISHFRKISSGRNFQPILSTLNRPKRFGLCGKEGFYCQVLSTYSSKRKLHLAIGATVIDARSVYERFHEVSLGLALAEVKRLPARGLNYGSRTVQPDMAFSVRRLPNGISGSDALFQVRPGELRLQRVQSLHHRT